MRFSKGLVLFLAASLLIVTFAVSQGGQQHTTAQSKNTQSLIQSLIDSKQPFILASITTGGQYLLVDGTASTVSDLGDSYVCVTSTPYFENGPGTMAKAAIPTISTVCMDFAALIVMR